MASTHACPHGFHYCDDPDSVYAEHCVAEISMCDARRHRPRNEQLYREPGPSGTCDPSWYMCPDVGENLYGGLCVPHDKPEACAIPRRVHPMEYWMHHKNDHANALVSRNREDPRFRPYAPAMPTQPLGPKLPTWDRDSTFSPRDVPNVDLRAKVQVEAPYVKTTRYSDNMLITRPEVLDSMRAYKREVKYIQGELQKHQANQAAQTRAPPAYAGQTAARRRPSRSRRRSSRAGGRRPSTKRRPRRPSAKRRPRRPRRRSQRPPMHM